ncbi:GTP pyrophosphokinase family protein [Psychrobacillus sp. NPDC096426]|uniref:GTP pyrophosphokinase n=1 Tax=Psychrobacillus sp. NPDC096426 TaxID=3364491 RepID=UPI00381DBE08
MSEEIIKQYETEKPRYESLKNKCESLILDLLENRNIKYHKIESRIKEKESLEKKIKSESKEGKYSDLGNITDIFGIRIITYFEDDVDKVADLLKKEFNFDVLNSVDKRWGSNPSVFGYASLHQVLSVSDSRKSLTEYEYIKDLKFEVQIRSILQHAWAEIEHDIGYKNTISVPIHLTRGFSRIAGLLELADIEFKRIRDELEDYTEEVKNKIIDEKYDLLIDSVTFKEFLLNSDTVNRIGLKLLHLVNSNAHVLYEDTPLESTLDKLNFLKINSISQLDNLLNEKESDIVSFADAWFTKRDLKSKYENINGVPIDISSFYLSLVLLAEKNDIDYSKKFISSFLADSSDDVAEVSSDILSVYNSILK